MTGLETILEQIGSDAGKEAAEQLSAANKQAEEILAAAKEKAAQKTADVLREGEEKAQDIRSRADSSAQLERRNAMLSFKQQVIRDAISDVRASLENAPAEEYFSMLLQLAGRCAPQGPAEMRLNLRDLDRLPADFGEKLKKAAPQGEISVSKEPLDIESGFVLVHEGIDVNCTFRAIFEDAEGALRDAVGKILFPVA